MSYNSGLISNFKISNLLIMKNYYLLLFFLSATITQSQVINFPDANFKAKLLEADVNNTIAKDSSGNPMKIDSNNNGEIETSEALLVAQMVLYHYPYDVQFSISSLEGIQNFTNLTKLECYANDLTSLPVMTDLVHLTYFDCSSNHLTEIHSVENLTNLEVLVVSWNEITSVNLSNLINLWAFNCQRNLLSCIDASATKVTRMWCDYNPNLVNVIIQNNTLTSSTPRLSPTIPPPLPYLNFTQNPNLAQICYDNGEYVAVIQGFFGDSTAGVNITTTCAAFDCTALSNTIVTAHLFSVFPNPVSNQLNISLLNNVEIKSVMIYDTLGQKIINANNQLTIDVSRLTQGTYFVTIETDSGKETQKIIKL